MQEENLDGDAVCVLCHRNAFPHDSDDSQCGDPYFYIPTTVRVSRPCGHIVHDRCQEVWIHRRDLCSEESRRGVCAVCGIRFQSQECLTATRARDLFRPENVIKNQAFRREYLDLSMRMDGPSAKPVKKKYNNQVETDQPQSRRRTGRRRNRNRRGGRGSGDNKTPIAIVGPIRSFNQSMLPDHYFESIESMIYESRTCSFWHIFRITCMIVFGILSLLYCWYM